MQKSMLNFRKSLLSAVFTIAVFLLVSLAPAPAEAAIAIVQTKNASGTASGSAAAITVSSLGAGNTVAVFLFWNGSATLATITDSAGNTYTQDAQLVSNPFGDGFFFASFIAHVATASTTLTFHFATATPGFKYSLTELSGTSATQPDVAGNFLANSGIANGANLAVSTALTVATANSAILGFIANDNQDASGITAGTGFTRGTVNATEPGFEAGEFQLGVSTGSIASQFTLTAANGTSHTYVGVMAIRPASAGGAALAGAASSATSATAALTAGPAPFAPLSIGLGTTPNDGTGDPARAAFTKLNAMTAQLYGTRSVQTPTTGFTQAPAHGVTQLVLNPAGTLATGTVTFPPTPGDNQPFELVTTQTITTLTLNTSDGSTIDSAPTTITAAAALQYRFIASLGIWLREQ